MKTKLGLENEYGQSISLKSVSLEGQLEGLLLTMKVKQRYLNDSDESIEASYTFPAGWGANLMGFSVELNGKLMKAMALSKKQAESRYEEAISKGDAPVMLEKSPLGLYTANIGNLKPGDVAIVEIEYAQLLRFEKGRLRITVPTVIGERYGDATTQGQIKPHQSVNTNALAEYPFSAQLDIIGHISLGKISCQSHKAEISKIPGGCRVKLNKGGLLDRDFVVTVEDLVGTSFATTCEDGEQYAVIASFCPKLPVQESTPFVLKILVDCSGSMQGDSIEQAQEAIYELGQRLTESDMVSYSKFGSTVLHSSKHMERCTPTYLKDVLAKAVHETAADMGGTELNDALTSTFKLGLKEAKDKTCDLLLITDGDVWGIEELVKQAKECNHRIFAIGVGAAPAESLLREMAEQTGGACELVTPSESISESVLRMTQRMRSARTTAIRIEWEEDVLWHSELPKQVFADETIHVLARTNKKPNTPPKLHWTAQAFTSCESAENIESDKTGTLPRMVAGAQLPTMKVEEEAEAIALKYQLASQYTNLLLIHVRDDDDKADGLPMLQKIEQMQAAGWGGFGTTVEIHSYYSISEKRSDVASINPAVWRSSRSRAASNNGSISNSGMDDIEIPAFLRTQVHTESANSIFAKDTFSPDSMLVKFNELSSTTNDFRQITSFLKVEIANGYVWDVLIQLAETEDEIDVYWACLLFWVSANVPGVVTLTRHSNRFLNVQISSITGDLVDKLEIAFELAFPLITKDAWSRAIESKQQSLFGRIKNLFSGNS